MQSKHAQMQGESGDASATVIGPPQEVYRWSTDHCPGFRGNFETHDRCPNDVAIGCDPDVPDAPLKAFRNASGAVVVVAPVDLGGRNLVGASLSSVKHDCHVMYNSTLDYNMAHNACREWNQSPFAFVNGTIFALTHMEFHDRTTQMGLWSSVTLLKSSDGGQNWGHALPPPRHIVAAAPYKYETSGPQSVLFGFRSPSNILQSRTDDFYYAFVTAGWGHGASAIGQKDGTCLMRTRDLSDPSSWRAWGGTAFNISLAVNPYINNTLLPSEHICESVIDMTYPSLLWSSYFERYMVVGTTAGNDRRGWSFQLSVSLDNPHLWGPPVAIATGQHIQPAGNASHRSIDVVSR